MTDKKSMNQRDEHLQQMKARRQIVIDATTINGSGLLGFDEDIFKYDNWSADDGINFLVGVKHFNVRKDLGNILEVKTLANELYTSEEDGDITAEFEKQANRLWNIWRSGDHDSPNPPSYYIEWALSKNIKINWLDYVIENGLLTNIGNEVILEKTLKNNRLFDNSSSTYPPELDIAIQAWRAVKDLQGKGKPKAKIRAWLDANTQLSNEAKDRICIVANWDKVGGATRTN